MAYKKSAEVGIEYSSIDLTRHTSTTARIKLDRSGVCLQINTYGSAKREVTGIASQTIVFKKESLVALKKLLEQVV